LILLWGVPGDPPMDAVHAALLNMGADVAFVDQRLNSQTIVELNPTQTGPLSGSIEAPGVNIDVLNISCAYIRPVETAKAVGAGNVESVACRTAMLADMALIAWADMCTVPVINRPRSMGANHSKPYQATLIQACGFLSLRTLITTDPAAARSFIETERNAVYKFAASFRAYPRVTCRTCAMWQIARHSSSNMSKDMTCACMSSVTRRYARKWFRKRATIATRIAAARMSDWSLRTSVQHWRRVACK
jgi:hypothetical protein